MKHRRPHARCLFSAARAAWSGSSPRSDSRLLGRIRRHAQSPGRSSGPLGLTWAETSPADSATLAQFRRQDDSLQQSEPHRTRRHDVLDRDDVFTRTHATASASQRTASAHDGSDVAVPPCTIGSRTFKVTRARARTRRSLKTKRSEPPIPRKQPCGYSLDKWISGEIAAPAALGFPVIYNALSDMSDHDVAPGDRAQPHRDRRHDGAVLRAVRAGYALVRLALDGNRKHRAADGRAKGNTSSATATI